MITSVKFRIIGAVVLSLIATAMLFQGVGFAGPPMSASVNFGQDGVGSGNNPNGLARGHDESGEAVDNLVPRTAVISAGGEVYLTMPGESIR